MNNPEMGGADPETQRLVARLQQIQEQLQQVTSQEEQEALVKEAQEIQARLGMG